MLPSGRALLSAAFIMELKQVNFGYSLKNIPMPTKRVYLKSMISKLEHFIKHLRWRAFFHDHKAECEIDKKDVLYGFKSNRTPLQHDGPSAFEEDLYNMVKNIKFKNVCSNFQSRLINDVTKINKSPNLFVPADKTNNLYKLLGLPESSVRFWNETKYKFL